MAKIRCPACNASGAICSTCGGKRLVEADGPYNWTDFTETEENFKRVDRETRKARKRP